MKKVNKTTARKMYNNGVTIYLLPSNVGLNSVWVSPCPVNNIDNNAIYSPRSFDAVINEFEYYNCNNELGRYTHYYINTK